MVWGAGFALLGLVLGLSLGFFAPARGVAAQEGTPEADVTEEPTETPTQESAPVIVYQVTPTVNPELAEVLADGWLRPLNLSRSGATDAPQMVRDSFGIMHVLWRDAIDGLVYTNGNGESWSTPEAPELPFATRRFFELDPEDPTPVFTPVLAADRQGRIHAFWLDTEGEGGDVFYHSSVPAGSFTDFEAWTGRFALDSAASRFALAADDAQRLHLVYIRNDESLTRPSGVYYRRLEANGSWSTAVLLYASRYLRAVPADEANVQILVSNEDDLLVGWDDTGREQVFFTRSLDGGDNWEAPQEIDRRAPEDDATAAGPGNLTLGASGGSVLLTWRAGHEPGRACAQYVKSSSDGGASWSLRRHVDTIPDCLATTQFATSEQGLFLLGTTVQEGVQRGVTEQTAYLLAWDGTQLSDPQVQEALSEFTNPDTFQAVAMRCHQALGEGAAIQVVGCDDGLGQDIWLTQREMGDTAEWFPPAPIWNGPTLVGSTETKANKMTLIADEVGGVHAFWSDGEGPSVFYAGWNGQSWSAGRAVVTTPNGRVEQVAAATANERLYLVWRDSATGLHFSQAAVERPSEWSAPRPLVEDEPSASAPSLAADRAGGVYIAYAVALNEPRGIYLLRSADAGGSWSAPMRVFDGTAAGWEMVDQPSLARTEDGHLHLLWARRTLPPDSRTLALAGSRSEDLGQTWSTAEPVTEAQAEWNTLVGAGERFLHRLWGEDNNGRLILWHSFSEDSGLNWSRPAQVTGLSEATSPAVTVDPGKRPHILAVDGGRLVDWVWDGERWAADENLDVPFTAEGALGAAASLASQLVALYAGEIPGETTTASEAGSSLFNMDRPLDIATELLAPLPTLTPTPMPTGTPAPTATPQPTPTLAFSAEQNAGLIGPIAGLPAESSQILLGVLPAGLIVLLAFVVGIRVIRKR
jgi:hypothetical protein